MQQSLPPCPECGGPRAFFQEGSPGIAISLWSELGGGLHPKGYTCLECGHTILRIHPDDMRRLREVIEKAKGKAPHPCPECEGERVFFKWVKSDAVHSFPVPLYACVCLECGYTTERPHPNDLGKLRNIAETRKSDRL